MFVTINIDHEYLDYLKNYLNEYEPPFTYPRNHGKSWSQEDRETLLFCLFAPGEYFSLTEIAKELDRTPYAIECQLDAIFNPKNFKWDKMIDRVGSEDWKVRFTANPEDPYSSYEFEDLDYYAGPEPY